MAVTYEPIATTTLSSNQASVTFSSISGSYTDLVLVTSAKSSAGDAEINMQLNDDTGSNYSFTYVGGNGSSALSGRGSSQTRLAPVEMSDVNYQMGIVNFLNYSNTTTYKTMLSTRQNLTSGTVFKFVNLWRSTSAITKIYLYNASGANFVSGSTFSLYGIKAA